MDHFELVSEYQPTGDQPQAIAELVKGFKEGNQCETHGRLAIKFSRKGKPYDQV